MSNQMLPTAPESERTDTAHFPLQLPGPHYCKLPGAWASKLKFHPRQGFTTNTDAEVKQ